MYTSLIDSCGHVTCEHVGYTNVRRLLGFVTGGTRASYYSCQQEAFGAGAHSGGPQLSLQGQRQHRQQRCQQLY